jgi:hypothetical protein
VSDTYKNLIDYCDSEARSYKDESREMIEELGEGEYLDKWAARDYRELCEKARSYKNMKKILVNSK